MFASKLQKTKVFIKAYFLHLYYAIRKRPPQILELSYYPLVLLEGGFVQISWKVKNAYPIRLEPKVGIVKNQDSIILGLRKAGSFTFTLKADGWREHITQDLCFVVRPLSISSPEKPNLMPNLGIEEISALAFQPVLNDKPLSLSENEPSFDFPMVQIHNKDFEIQKSDVVIAKNRMIVQNTDLDITLNTTDLQAEIAKTKKIKNQTHN
jgi:hypothetical protein